MWISEDTGEKHPVVAGDGIGLQPALGRWTSVLAGLAGFASVSPRMLADRELLGRTDTKFMVAGDRLERLLAELASHYSMLRDGGLEIARYRTLYYDTPALRCWTDHRKGKRPRYKVRVRHYPDRRLSFLELKSLLPAGDTFKVRSPKDFGVSGLTETDRQFIATHCDLHVAELVPQIWTNFARLTLVGLETVERVTVDVNVRFVRDEKKIRFGYAAIFEVKQPAYDRGTPVMRALRAARQRPTAASKYVIGLERFGIPRECLGRCV